MRFAALALVMLASCYATPSAVRLAAERNPVSNEERTIAGVLTLYTEGSLFKECPLRESWNCLLNRAPECGLETTSEGSRAINLAIEKAGAYQGFATFEVVMIGKRVDGITSGQSARVDCEFQARAILKVDEVPSVPPPE